MVAWFKNSRLDSYFFFFVACGAPLFIILLAVYLFTTPTTVALEDDGLFLLSAYGPGVSHPPGYPLYTLVSHIFIQLPLGTVAFKGHMVSGIFGALTGVMVAGVALTISRSAVTACIAALAYGFSLRFWSQSIVAEVYTLNTFLFFLALYLSLRASSVQGAAESSGRNTIGLKLYLVLIALVYGLSLANHWPLMVLSTPALMVLLWPYWRSIVRCFPFLLLAFCFGLTPYIWMYFYSQTDPYISFYGPITNLSDFFYVIGRQGYAAVDNSISSGWFDKLNFLLFFIKELFRQFTPAGFVLCLLGAYCLYRNRKTPEFLSLLLAFVGNSVALILLLDFDFDQIYKSAFRVYPLIAFGVASIWLAYGTHRLCLRLSVRTGSTPFFLTTVFGVGLTAAILLVNFPVNNRSDYKWAEEYGRFILGRLDKDSALLVKSDIETGVLGYLTLIEGVRPDVALYNQYGLVFGNRLRNPFQEKGEYRRDKLNAFIERSSRPIYYMDNVPAKYGYRDFILYKEVGSSKSPDVSQAVITPAVLKFMLEVVSRDPETDDWTKFHKIILLEKGVPIISSALEEYSNPNNKKVMVHILQRSLRFFNCQLARIRWLSKQQSSPQRDDELENLIAVAERNLEGALTKADKAGLYRQKALWLLENKREKQAMAAYGKSVKLWFHPQNESVNELLKLYRRHNREKDYEKLTRRMSEAGVLTTRASGFEQELL